MLTFHKTFKNVIVFVLSLSMFVLFISPMLWMVISSFKPEYDIFKNLDSLKAFYVEHPTFASYDGAFHRSNLLRYIINSLVYLALLTVLGMVVNSLCGYSLAKLSIPGKKYLVLLIISLFIIPFESIVLPLFIIINYFGWVNTLHALYVPFVANCFNIYLFRQFFLGIPVELEDAARIDGASVLQTFMYVVLPISKPVFATVFILTFVTHWGDFLWPLIVVSDDTIRPVQVGLQFLFTDIPIIYGDILAGMTVTTIPVIIVFLFLQKYYIAGIATSGIKG